MFGCLTCLMPFYRLITRQKSQVKLGILLQCGPFRLLISFSSSSWFAFPLGSVPVKAFGPKRVSEMPVCFHERTCNANCLCIKSFGWSPKLACTRENPITTRFLPRTTPPRGQVTGSCWPTACFSGPQADGDVVRKALRCIFANNAF